MASFPTVPTLKKSLLLNAVYNYKFLVFLLIAFPLLTVWQGLDFTDTGFALANAQLIFHSPSSILYGGGGGFSGYWLTNIIGGLWLLLFGNPFGAIGFKVASILVEYSTIFFAFLILRSYFSQEKVLLGLLFSEIFIDHSYWISYDILSALSFVVAAYFLIEGMVKKQDLWIFLSGFVLGIGTFIRISNILGLSLIICIFAHNYWKKIELGKSVKSALFFITGAVVSSILMFGVMIGIGQFHLYFSSIADLFVHSAENPSSTHSFSYLIRLFIENHIIVAALAIGAIVGFILILKSYSLAQERFPLLSNFFLAGIFVAGLALSLGSWGLPYFYANYIYCVYLIYGLLGVMLLKNIIFADPKRNLSLVSLIALLILVIIPLGSNNGVYETHLGMWIAMPIGIIFLTEFNGCDLTCDLQIGTHLQKIDFSLQKNKSRTLFSVILIVFFTFSLITAFQMTYRDSRDRLAMVYSVNQTHLSDVFTTKDRAVVVQQLVDALPHYVKKDDYVIAFGNIPMIYYLTQTRPYLDNPWPETFAPDQFSEHLNQSFADKPSLPVIVLANYDTRSIDWPTDKHPIEDKNYSLCMAILEKFVTAHSYRVGWTNDFFTILTPNPAP